MPDLGRRRACIALGASAAAWSGLLAAQPAKAAGRILTVEDGGTRLTLRSGDDLRLLRDFAPRRPLHGAPQITRDGGFAYFISADGWLTQFDLSRFADAAQVRVGTQALVFSLAADGRLVMAAGAPATLSLFDANLARVRDYVVQSLAGVTAEVSGIRDSGPRNSFVVALAGVPELWEISRDPAAPPIFDGLVHDYRMGEGIARPGYLGVRRTPLDEPVELVTTDAAGRHVLVAAGAAPGAGTVGARMQVINLDVRRAIAQWPLRDAASPDGATAFDAGGRPMLAIADRSQSSVEVIDAVGWKAVGRLPGASGRVIVRAHPKAAHLWVGRQPSHGADVISLFDKTTLEPIGTVDLGGARLSDLAFTADGSRVLAAVREGQRGALITYDARTQAEVARAPAGQPVSLHPLPTG